jgi:hypothetical protein
MVTPLLSVSSDMGVLLGTVSGVERKIGVDGCRLLDVTRKRFPLAHS